VNTFLQVHGPEGVFVAMVLESAGVPVPSEVVLPLAGFLVAVGRWTFLEATLVAVAGQLVGSFAAYAIGFWGGRPAVEAIDRAFGRHDLAPAERWFARRGHWAVFWGRFLPVVRTYISFPAGIAAMPLARFALFSFLGALPWTLVLTWIGLRFGTSHSVTAHITAVLYILLVLVVVFVATRVVLARRRT
jgi:membrane protein DedA with SNARE-associated domain